MMNDIPRFDLSHLMGDDIHIKCGDKFSSVELHWHDYYELIYYYKADVTGTINGTELDFKGNSLYLLTPFDFHKTKNNDPSGEISFINISFSKDSLDNDIISKINGAYYLRDIREDAPEYALLEFLNIHAHTLKNRKNNKRHILSVLINIILEKGSTVDTNKGYLGRSAIIHKVFEYISENFSQPISLADVAGELHLAPAYFSSVFSKSAGCTFVHFLTSFRLNYSKQLLISTDKSVTQICFECGFSSLSHYLREFKTWYGVTPTAYRKNNTL